MLHLRARRVCRSTRYTDIPFDVLADNNRFATLGRREIDTLKMNTVTGRTWTACEIRNDIARLATTRSINVNEVDVCDVHLARVFCTRRFVDIEIALIQHNWGVCVLNVYILVRYVVNITISNVWSSPRFESCTVLAIDECDVLEPRVRDVILDAGVLANGAHRDTVGAVTPQVLDKNVGGVGLG